MKSHPTGIDMIEALWLVDAPMKYITLSRADAVTDT
jgi:hypothetical protein